LESLQNKYREKGFRILAFPANNFGRQEPGTNKEIKEFCASKFHVSFDMFAKVSVKGDDMCDLYKFLTGVSGKHEFAGDVKWNFQKYLIDGDGKIIAKFPPPVSPEDEKVTAVIEKALAKS